MCFLTAKMANTKPIKKFTVIAYSYVINGNFIFDIAATIPGYMIVSGGDRRQLYWLKLIRFIHFRTIYGAVQEILKIILLKFGLNKANVEKTIYILVIIVNMGSIVHDLACMWIYIGKITECSWIHQWTQTGYHCEMGLPLKDKEDVGALYIVAIYWVITTLTTVGYGDFKGY